MHLSDEQISHYRTFGYVSPIDVMSSNEAAAVRVSLEAGEKRYPEQLDGDNRNNAHYAFSFLWDLTQDPRILVPVADLVGEIERLWCTALVIKEPMGTAFVGWHQDATYMGLDGTNMVTPWLALTDSNAHNGCVAVLPGSHTAGLLDHVDTFGDDNILTRGQEVAVDLDGLVNLELEPGQMSIHHPGSCMDPSRIRRTSGESALRFSRITVQASPQLEARTM
jgi:non-heme Fe2+,alpha-ketoglutarate-dependent halogenase